MACFRLITIMIYLLGTLTTTLSFEDTKNMIDIGDTSQGCSTSVNNSFFQASKETEALHSAELSCMTSEGVYPLSYKSFLIARIALGK